MVLFQSALPLCTPFWNVSKYWRGLSELIYSPHKNPSILVIAADLGELLESGKRGRSPHGPNLSLPLHVGFPCNCDLLSNTVGEGTTNLVGRKFVKTPWCLLWGTLPRTFSVIFNKLSLLCRPPHVQWACFALPFRAFPSNIMFISLVSINLNNDDPEI